MSRSVLEEIVAKRRVAVAGDKERFADSPLKRPADMGKPLSLGAAVRAPGLSLIAEAKTASPSRGRIRDNLSIEEIVRLYESAGASALSILTEPEYFNGDWSHLRAAKAASRLPVLCKDFIIDEFQLLLAEANGADAVLLIAASLNDETLGRLIDAAHKLGMEVLTEVINASELDRVLASRTDLIGINNRDLHTLDVNMNVSLELLRGIGHDRPIVVESGIFTREDAAKLEKQGADGILVGTALMESDDIAAKLKELLGKD